VSWLSGLTEPVITSTPTRVKPLPVKPEEKKVRKVVRALRAGHTTTDEIVQATALTQKEVWNVIGELKKAGALVANPVTYTLTNPDY
jgi:predicted Rossmann fold nucleotide-binding protein DprA/Smf involved in DNA uptake